MDKYTHFGKKNLCKSNCQLNRRKTIAEALDDLKNIYIQILQEVGNYHSIRTIYLLFIATYIILTVYSDDPIIATHIACCFQLISYQSRDWNLFDLESGQSDSICILI